MDELTTGTVSERDGRECLDIQTLPAGLVNSMRLTDSIVTVGGLGLIHYLNAIV